MRSILRVTVLALFAGVLLAGCASAPPSVTAPGEGGARSITLHHPASGETVAVTYRTERGYDPDALQEIALLFRDRRSGVTAPIDPALVDMLADLRDGCGVPADRPIHVTSGYRSEATNVALAGRNPHVADNSYHLRGQAADIHIPGVEPRRIADEAAALRRGGYALYPHSGHVHVDTGPFRTWKPRDGGRPVTVEARAVKPGKPPVRLASRAAPAPKPVAALPAKRAGRLVLAQAPDPAARGGRN